MADSSGVDQYVRASRARWPIDWGWSRFIAAVEGRRVAPEHALRRKLVDMQRGERPLFVRASFDTQPSTP